MLSLLKPIKNFFKRKKVDGRHPDPSGGRFSRVTDSVYNIAHTNLDAALFDIPGNNAKPKKLGWFLKSIRI